MSTELIKTPVSFKLDTGAQVKFIPLHVFQLECNGLKSTTQKINVEGQCTLVCSYMGTQGQHQFYVVSTQAPPILGLSSCLSLNLIQLILSVEGSQGSDTVSLNPGDILTEYKEVFEGLGSFPGVHKIQLKPDVELVIHPPRTQNPNSSSRQDGRRIEENGSLTGHNKSHRTHRLGELDCHTQRAMHRCLVSVLRFEPCS